MTQPGDPPPGGAGRTRRLAAILAADVVGYSRLMSEDEEGTLGTLATYQDVIAGLVTEHQGRVFNLAGDAVMAEFASAAMAVRCAVAIQRAIRRRNADLADQRRMVFRIGINLGDVIERGSDLYGDGVNIAARLQALAKPERITVAAAVHDQIAVRLGFRCEFLGERTVKNIAQPVRVYGVDWELEPPVPVRELRSGTLTLPDKASLAVLPLANMSGDAEQEYFADGLTEDLITALAKYRWFFVIARNSSFTYKGRSVTVQQVGRELGVHYVIEGSTRRSGDRVRVTAQLVDAEAGRHVWAERYDRDLAELFAVQDEIVGRVVGAIEPELLRSEFSRARRKSPESLDTWDLIMRGMAHFYHFTKGSNLRARELFRRAIEADSSYAEGHIWLARCNEANIFYGWSENRDADLAEGWQAALGGVRLAHDDPYAHYAIGVQNLARRQPERATAAAQTAIDLSPSFALGHFLLGASRLWAGRAALAVEPLHRGLRLNPHDPQAFLWLQLLALANFLQGDSGEAAALAADAAASRPDSFSAHCFLACSLADLGRAEEARQEVGEMQRVMPSAYALGELLGRLAHPADHERVTAALRRAGWQETRSTSG